MFGRKESFISTLVRRLLNTSGEWLAPQAQTCICCGKQRGHHSNLYGIPNICRSCEEQIPWIQEPLCAVCGRHEICYDCSRRMSTYFVCNRSAVHYDPAMKDWLALLKYRGNERMMPLFADMLSRAYRQLCSEFDSLAQQGANCCLTYIPLSEQRLQERGFNQAEQFALGLGRKYNLPVVSLLTRTRHTDKQSYKTRSKRLEALQGVFAFDREGSRQVVGAALGSALGWANHDSVKSGAICSHLAHLESTHPSPLNVILVDDVYTTGSTLNECARIIVSEMGASVYGLTWAR